MKVKVWAVEKNPNAIITLHRASVALRYEVPVSKEQHTACLPVAPYIWFAMQAWLEPGSQHEAPAPAQEM